MDSDNFCDIDYCEAFINFWILNAGNYNTKYIYQPMIAIPAHNFSKYIGILINKENWNSINDECLLNNGNYVFHKSIVKYIEPILSENIQTYAIDVKYMNYIWIKNSEVSIVVVPNMKYIHTIHPGSLYITTAKISDTFNYQFDWKI